MIIIGNWFVVTVAIIAMFSFLCSIFLDNDKGLVFLGIYLISLVYIIIIAIGSVDGPTAMDVYKGKTTLQISYKDSIAVDSIVVYK